MIRINFFQSTGKFFFRSFIVSRHLELESLQCLKTVNQELSGCAMGETPQKAWIFLVIKSFGFQLTELCTEYKQMLYSGPGCNTREATRPYAQLAWLYVRRNKYLLNSGFITLKTQLSQQMGSKGFTWLCQEFHSADDRGNWINLEGPGIKTLTSLVGLLFQEATESSWKHGWRRCLQMLYFSLYLLPDFLW